jgi:hypothetical protein
VHQLWSQQGGDSQVEKNEATGKDGRRPEGKPAFKGAEQKQAIAPARHERADTVDTSLDTPIFGANDYRL